MRALHERGVLRDDLHERLETELLLQQEPGDREHRETDLGVNEELDRVVARLAMDIHAAREIGLTLAFFPPVIREPAVSVGNDDEVAATHMLNAGGGLAVGVEHLRDTGRGEQDLANFLADRGIEDHDVRDLVVDDGEGLGVKGIEREATILGLELEPAMLAEDLVQRDGAVDGGDGVFGDDEDFDAAGFEEFGKVSDELVDVMTRDIAARIGRAKALEVVIEMRQVDQAEVGLLVFFNPAGAVSDPLR